MKSFPIIIGGGASGSTNAMVSALLDEDQRVVVFDNEGEINFITRCQPFFEMLPDIAQFRFNVPKRNPRLRPIPEDRLSQLSNSQNNKPCPCGSGLKYKKCYKK
jgi:flavin-dependent dehydrogenase